MIALPIPLIMSLLLAFLFLRALMARRKSWLFLSLLAASAWQGLVISMVQHYGVETFRWIAPVTAVIIPPLAWVTFRATAVRAFDPARDALHLLPVGFTVFCVVFEPVALDIVVPGVFLIYGLAILMALRAGSDGLPMMRLETGDLPRRIWAGIALALILSAFSDGLIAMTQMMDAGWLRPWIISVFSSLSLGIIGMLSLSQSLTTDAPESAPDISPQDVQRDSDVMARLKHLMTSEQLFLDPDLTLVRLSKRLRVPAKQVSAAINRATGQNVSRYVNEFRIRYACDRLKADEPVTLAMLNSGFNTKSNFNREFLRVMGCAPSVWISENRPP
ncbi:helix-turn-helix domain-containing protein [Parasulfitobacter algicola]|nr:helix-turn-helix domain-containing protein [Sulfitobacter algicola]